MPSAPILLDLDLRFKLIKRLQLLDINPFANSLAPWTPIYILLMFKSIGSYIFNIYSILNILDF